MIKAENPFINRNKINLPDKGNIYSNKLSSFSVKIDSLYSTFDAGYWVS